MSATLRKLYPKTMLNTKFGIIAHVFTSKLQNLFI